MAFKDDLKEVSEAVGWFFTNRLNTASARSVSEQFDRTKKVSDFVGFLTRLMFLAAIQAFISEASKNASITSQFIYAIVGIILLLIQAYFSYSISFIVTKAVIKTIPERLSIDMSFELGRNRQTVLFFAILLFLQFVYFGVNSTLRESVSRGAAAISAVPDEKAKTNTQPL
ncbi:hypothetical protein ACFYE8_14035 [Rhizobium leguminosarum]|uniref:hypothetical protein n=1 Tax=Rhizobium leguminosarum TaxID=384 RepID=UPI0036DF9926